jgi:hypothetical protein
LNNLETLCLKMSSNILDILSKRHTEWLNMAKSFKLDNNDANELVQNMYLRMYDYTKDVKRIMYKTILFSDIDKENFKYIINKMSYDIDDFEDNYKKKVNLEALCNKIDSVIEDWYWYDKKLTKLYLNTDMSMRDISKETKISLSSIFNTLTNAKEKIRKESKEEYKKYKS